MFTFIKRPLQITDSHEGWLGENRWIYSLKLKNIPSPFDPEPLWAAKNSGNDGIIDESGNNERRLKEALANHRDTNREREERSLLVDVKKIFTDVSVRISAKIWQADAQMGGKKLESLAENLSKLHYHDFGDCLASSRRPSYAVMPDKLLSDDEAVFQFGPGVFVPKKGDLKIGNLSIRLKDNGKKGILPSWIFWENGLFQERAAAVYARQRYIVIGPSSDTCATPSPVWLGHGKGCLLIDLYSRTPYGDGEHVGVDEVMDKGNSAICSFNDMDSESERNESLLVEIAAPPRMQMPPSSKDSCGSDDEFGGSIGRPGIGLTHSPTHREMDKGAPFVRNAAAGALIYLEGIALPRINTPGGAIESLESWSLWMDDTGKPVCPKETETDGLLGFCAWSNKKYLEISEPGKSGFSKVTKLPLSFKDQNEKPFELVSSRIIGQYYAVLQLPFPPEPWPINESETIIGRGAEGVRLSFLNISGSLKWKPGVKRPGTLGALGLSRRHAAVSLDKGGLKIRTLSTEPIFILDGKGRMIRALTTGDIREYTISDGERFMVGCYLLRFDI